MQSGPGDADGRGRAGRRLIVRDVPVASEGPPPTDFTRLFAPRTIAVAGASGTRAGLATARSPRTARFGWDDGLYAVHPNAKEVDGVAAVADLAEIDEPIDYLLVAVPAARCAEVVRATAGRVPFVHVVSGGFDEVGVDGAALSEELLATAWAVKTRARPELHRRVLPGRPAGVPAERTTRAEPSASCRRAAGCRVTSSRGAPAAACGSPRCSAWATPSTSRRGSARVAGRRSRHRRHRPLSGGSFGGGSASRRVAPRGGEKPVVLLVGGASSQGADAVASHTGAMAGERRVREAIASSTGVALVHTLEPFVGALAYLQRWWGVGKAGGDVLVAGAGGGASVLATDACDRAGLRLEPTTPAVRGTLRGLGLGAGTSVANPLEIPFGPAAPVDTLRSVLVPLLRSRPIPTCSCTSTSPRTTGTAPEASSRWSPNSPISRQRRSAMRGSAWCSATSTSRPDPTRTARRRGWGSRPGDVPHARQGRGRDRSRGAIGALGAMSDHPFRDRAAIVGVGATPYSKNSGVSTLTLALHAITDAVADAGLTMRDIDGVACHRVGDSAPATIVSESLGLHDAHFLLDRFGSAGGAGSDVARRTWARPGGGDRQADYVCAACAAHDDRMGGTTAAPDQLEFQYQVPYGYATPPQQFAMIGRGGSGRRGGRVTRSRSWPAPSRPRGGRPRRRCRGS